MDLAVSLGFWAVAFLGLGFAIYRRRKHARSAVVRPVLPEAYASRLARLEERQHAIVRAAKENRRLAGGLLASELTELDELVAGFAELAGACARWESHLAAADLDDLEAELRRHETDAERAIDAQKRELARRNLAVLLARKDQLAEIRNKLTSAKGQLDLVENSFRLIADEVVALETPGEIKGKLDELLAGVEAVREVARAEPHLQAQRSK